MKNYIALNLFKCVQFFHYILCIKNLLSCFLSCRISPSQSCGPFRVYSVENFIFFDTIRNLIFTFPSDAQKFFHIFGTMAFFIPAIGLTWWDRCSKLTLTAIFFLYILFGKKSNLRDLALMFSILLIKCTDTTDTIIITGLVHVLTLF